MLQFLFLNKGKVLSVPQNLLYRFCDLIAGQGALFIETGGDVLVFQVLVADRGECCPLSPFSTAAKNTRIMLSISRDLRLRFGAQHGEQLFFSTMLGNGSLMWQVFANSYLGKTC